MLNFHRKVTFVEHMMALHVPALDPALRIGDIVAHESRPGAARETTPQNRQHFVLGHPVLLYRYIEIYLCHTNNTENLKCKTKKECIIFFY